MWEKLRETPEGFRETNIDWCVGLYEEINTGNLYSHDGLRLSKDPIFIYVGRYIEPMSASNIINKTEKKSLPSFRIKKAYKSIRTGRIWIMTENDDLEMTIGEQDEKIIFF